MNESITSSSSSTQDILQGVVVRLILPEERERWDHLMREHHYLGLGRLIGESPGARQSQPSKQCINIVR